MAASGSLAGRLIIHIDIANVDEPIKFVTQVANSLPELVQEDINRAGTVYEIPLATYTAEVTQISGLVSNLHLISSPAIANHTIHLRS